MRYLIIILFLFSTVASADIYDQLLLDSQQEWERQQRQQQRDFQTQQLWNQQRYLRQQNQGNPYRQRPRLNRGNPFGVN